MECRYTAADPAVSTATLQLWLKLRYPYESFEFPGLEARAEVAGRLSVDEQAANNVAAQAQIIQRLRADPPDEPIRPLYFGVVELFEREHAFSQAVLEFLTHRDASRLAQALDRRFGLTAQEQGRVAALAAAALNGSRLDESRTLRDQFFNDHIMVDEQGRHFTDFHREFMRQYQVTIDCRCVKGC